MAAATSRHGAASFSPRATARTAARITDSLVGIGFDAGGAHVMDALGGGARIEPHDVERWRGSAARATANATAPPPLTRGSVQCRLSPDACEET